MRRTLLIFGVVALATAACQADVDVGTDPTPAPTDTEPNFTPTVEVGDCADLTATEGAPAGITMMDNFFEPSCVAVSSTQSIALTNAGNQLHNFSTENGEIDVDVEPGEDEETDEIGDHLRAGTYRVFCEYHEQQGMVGTLVVE